MVWMHDQCRDLTGESSDKVKYRHMDHNKYYNISGWILNTDSLGYYKYFLLTVIKITTKPREMK